MGDLPPSSENDEAARYASYFTGPTSPSYEDLYGHRSQNRGNDTLIENFANFFRDAGEPNNACAIISIILKIVIGIYYRNDCPVEIFLPIYLIGDGISSIQCARSTVDPFVEGKPSLKPVAAFISCDKTYFKRFWFIFGHFSIVRAFFHMTTDPNDIMSPQYCIFTVFYFTLMTIIFKYKVVLLYCFYFTIGAIFGMALLANNRSPNSDRALRFY